MIKYRRLSLKELKALEKEFVEFLAVNGVDAPKWQELKAENKLQADHFIDAFSNVVMEKSLQNICYIEHKTETDYKIFHFGDEKAEMIGLKSQGINFLEEDMAKISLEKVELIKGTKAYDKTREIELFDLMQKGCTVAERKQFALLKQLVK